MWLEPWEHTVLEIKEGGFPYYSFNLGLLVSVLSIGRLNKEQEVMKALPRLGYMYDTVSTQLLNESFQQEFLLE